MAESKTDDVADDLKSDFSPNPPGPYQLRKPLVHRYPPRPMPDLRPATGVEHKPLPPHPMPDLRPVGGDHRLVQNRTTGSENKLLNSRFVESAELRPPLEPQIVREPAERQYREIGKWVRRPEPPHPQPEPEPPHAQELPPVFKAKNIRFKKMSGLDWVLGKPAEFAGPESLEEIDRVAKYLREHPDKQVEIRASVGLEGPTSLLPKEFATYVMEKRAEAVIGRLKNQGIDPSRMHKGLGKIGKGADDRIVEFVFDPPTP